MGSLRLILAIVVIAAHAGFLGIPFPNEEPYNAWAMSLIDGRSAVVLFFIISGFYMAMVLNTKYQNNTAQFYLNRFLRLWPTYLVSLVFLFFFTSVFEDLVTFTKNCTFWGKCYVWFCNIFIVGSDSFWLVSLDSASGTFSYLPSFINENANGGMLFLNSPVFSIGVEMVFYLMAPFILKSVKRVWIYFYVGLAYYFAIVLLGKINIVYQYHMPPIGFLFFAMGALSWHYSNRKVTLDNVKMIFFFALSLLLLFVPAVMSAVIYIPFAVAVPFLFNLTKDNKVDRFLGELSYPVYILHYPVLHYLWGIAVDKSNIGWMTLVITVLIAIPVHLFLEEKVQKIRQQLIAQ